MKEQKRGCYWCNSFETCKYPKSKKLKERADLKPNKLYYGHGCDNFESEQKKEMVQFT